MAAEGADLDGEAQLVDAMVPRGVGFGAGRDCSFDEFFADARAVGLRDELRLSTWDLRPLTSSSEFLVAVLAR